MPSPRLSDNVTHPAAVGVAEPAKGALAPDCSGTRRVQAWSLRNRLLVLTVGTAALAWLVGGTVVTQMSVALDQRHRDQRLAQMSGTILAFALHELAEARMSPTPTVQGESDEHRMGLDLARYRYQVWVGGRLILSGPDGSDPTSPSPPLQAGYQTLTADRGTQRSYTTAPDSVGLQVWVSEQVDEPIGAWAWPGISWVALLLASLLAVGGGAVWVVMRALRPVASAAQALRTRSAQDVDPLVLADLPTELRPLLDALNQHLQRTAHRLSRESSFTALAAHELRTPLAALRMQAQVAARSPDAAARDAQLQALLASVDRSDHLITQLLTLARIEQAAGQTREELDLAALARHVAAECHEASHGTADGGAPTVQLDGPAPMVSGWPFALEVLLRNLILNARVHGAQAGSVTTPATSTAAPQTALQVVVHVGWHQGQPELQVDDNGPGIAAADRARVFERFVRLAAPGRTPGSGLGLAIVRAVADAHGAEVLLHDAPSGGLRVSVRFPRAVALGDTPDAAP